MSYHTFENVIDSMRGWKRPLYSYTRVYRTKNGVLGRIRLLQMEYGDEPFHGPSLKFSTKVTTSGSLWLSL